MKRTTKKWIIISVAIALPVILIAAIVPVAVRPGRVSLMPAPAVIRFWSADQEIALPAVRGGGITNVSWSIISETGFDADDEMVPAMILLDDSGTEGRFVSLLAEGDYFVTLPFADDVERAVVEFNARVSHRGRVSNLVYRLTIEDPREDTFRRLFSSNQTGRNAYRIQGIGNQRVFGLWDVAESGRRDSAIVGRTNMLDEGIYRNYELSGDVMDLAWRYRGDVDLRIELVGGALAPADRYMVVNVQSGDIGARTYVQDDVMRISVELNPYTGQYSRVKVQFLGEGVRTVRVSGRPSADLAVGFPNNTPFYSFTYNVVDAINAWSIEELKLVEMNARLDYILNGVYVDGYGYVINPLGTLSLHRQFVEANVMLNGSLNGFFYWDSVDSDDDQWRLNSSRFRAETTRRFVNANTGEEAVNPPARATSHFFREFARWAPSFRYRDIVVRADIETHDEATWFFGNVFGNGFRLDATAYANSYHQTYRNTHGTSFASNGMERLPFRAGQGWGEHFAFYMLSNDSVMCNITLTGMNIDNDGAPVRLTDYAWYGVLGTSALGGRLQNFQVGNMHVGGEFLPHRYVAGITVQNSILEKGVILFGVAYAPSFERPVTIDNSVLRYAGFTAVFGRGFSNLSGGNPATDSGFGFENAWEVRRNNQMGEVSGRPEMNQAFWGDRVAVGDRPATLPNSNISVEAVPGVYQRFGNFILLRDLFIYEVTTVPIVIDDNEAGTYVIFEGENNKYYTWLRLTDLVFPNFKFPMLPFWDESPVHGVTRLAQRIVAPILAENERLGVTIRERTTHLMNLPLISLGTSGGNAWCLDNVNWVESSIGGEYPDADTFEILNVVLGLEDITLDMFFLMPPRQINVYQETDAGVTGFGHSGFVTLYQQRRILDGYNGGIAGLINAMRASSEFYWAFDVIAGEWRFVQR
ncbi:MAG: hypothetical protein FWE01_02360 [Firmicutes bacterium]|nr:hypothetical protein [Bacillota bacterium]